MAHRPAVEVDEIKKEWPLQQREHDSSSSEIAPVVHPLNKPYAEHGATIDRTDTQNARENPSNAGLTWPRIRHALREPFSEFIGTFILIMFGDGVVAQVVLSKDKYGNYQSISWGWGIGVLLGVYASGISGAHINPAVTLANCIFRGFPWKKLPIYAFAQTLGAFCAAGVVYGNYKSAIDVYEGGASIRTVPGFSQHATAGIFCTYAQPFLTTTGQFFDEIIGTALLMFTIYSLKDDNNIGAGDLTPLGLFFIVWGIGACFGYQTGYAINPARDFGPRLMSYFLGYGSNVWTAGNYYFWVPIVAPLIGAVLGGFIYDFFIFTGESPINTPYMGLYRIFPSKREKYDGVVFNLEDRKEENPA